MWGRYHESGIWWAATSRLTAQAYRSGSRSVFFALGRLRIRIVWSDVPIWLRSMAKTALRLT